MDTQNVDFLYKFDTRLSSYASFFDHTWLADFLDIASKSRLSSPAFHLSRDWKGVALASRMSWLLIESLYSFQDGFLKHRPTSPELTINAIMETMASDLGIRRMARQRFIERASDLQRRFNRGLEAADPPASREDMWEQMIAEREFAMAVWTSQWLAYGAIFFAYENFLCAAIAAHQDDPDYRGFPFSKLSRDFLAAFPSLSDCVNSREVHIARLARNCLTHKGGVESEELKSLGHSIRVENGHLQIFPEDVLALFNFLKWRATEIANAAAGMPTLRIP